MSPEAINSGSKWACYVIGIAAVMIGVFAGAHKMPTLGTVCLFLAHFGLLGSAYLGPAINRLREIRQHNREWAEQYRWRN